MQSLKSILSNWDLMESHIKAINRMDLGMFPLFSITCPDARENPLKLNFDILTRHKKPNVYDYYVYFQGYMSKITHVLFR